MSQPRVYLRTCDGPTLKGAAHEGARSAKVEAGFAPDRALILLKKRMILSPNRSHFGGSCAARTNTLASLRGSIERIESHSDAYSPRRVALGHADADATLQGGLALGAMHEVFADAGRQSATATGFVAGRAADSPPAAAAWGGPQFDAQVVRNRHGPVGRRIMEWKCDECLFSKPAAYPQPVAAAPAHRPHQTPARVFKRKPAPDAIRGGHR